MRRGGGGVCKKSKVILSTFLFVSYRFPSPPPSRLPTNVCVCWAIGNVVLANLHKACKSVARHAKKWVVAVALSCDVICDERVCRGWNQVRDRLDATRGCVSTILSCMSVGEPRDDIAM